MIELKAKLEQKQETINNRQEEISEWKKHAATLEDSVHLLEWQLEEHKVQLEATQQRANDAIDRASKSEAVVSENQNADEKTLEHTASKASECINMLQALVAQDQETIKKQQDEISTYEKSAAELENVVELLEKKLAAQKDYADSSQQHIQQILQLESALEERESHDAFVDSLEKHVLEQKAAEANEHITILQDRHREEVARYNQRIAELATFVQSLEMQVDEHRGHSASAQLRARRATEHAERLEAYVSEGLDAIKKREDEIRALEQTAKEASKCINMLQGTIKKQQDEISRYERRIVELQNWVALLESRLVVQRDHADASVQQHVHQIRQLTSHLEGWHSSRGALEKCALQQVAEEANERSTMWQVDSVQGQEPHKQASEIKLDGHKCETPKQVNEHSCHSTRWQAVAYQDQETIKKQLEISEHKQRISELEHWVELRQNDEENRVLEQAIEEAKNWLAMLPVAASQDQQTIQKLQGDILICEKEDEKEKWANNRQLFLKAAF